MSIGTRYIFQFLAVLICLAVGLTSCAVTPTPVPRPHPLESPLSASSPVKTPVVGDASSLCPKGCLEVTEDCKIKGVVSGMGDKYYYTPDMPGYDKQLVLVQYDARWFCTVEDAVRNGWQKAPVP